MSKTTQEHIDAIRLAVKRNGFDRYSVEYAVSEAAIHLLWLSLEQKAEPARDNTCEVCGVRIVGSHYHCPNCGKTCSMMGHWDQAKNTYSCTRDEKGAAAVAKAFPADNTEPESKDAPAKLPRFTCYCGAVTIHIEGMKRIRCLGCGRVFEVLEPESAAPLFKVPTAEATPDPVRQLVEDLFNRYGVHGFPNVKRGAVTAINALLEPLKRENAALRRSIDDLLSKKLQLEAEIAALRSPPAKTGEDAAEKFFQPHFRSIIAAERDAATAPLKAEIERLKSDIDNTVQYSIEQEKKIDAMSEPIHAKYGDMEVKLDPAKRGVCEQHIRDLLKEIVEYREDTLKADPNPNQAELAHLRERVQEQAEEIKRLKGKAPTFQHANEIAGQFIRHDKYNNKYVYVGDVLLEIRSVDVTQAVLKSLRESVQKLLSKESPCPK